MDAAGHLYGTTTTGGNGKCSAGGCGTVFKLTGTKESWVYSFQLPPAAAVPGYAGLATDGKGNFYGTTARGGNGPCKQNGVRVGCGTIFAITSAGKETVLYNFQGGADGDAPNATLLLDSSSGILYGTTLAGGGKGPCVDVNGARIGCGTVFQLTLSTQAEKVLHRFCSLTNCADGDGPAVGGPLARDASGNLFGETSVGGPNGFGAIFKITPAGKETVLFSFACTQSGCSEGAAPIGGLTLDAVTNILYGTTEAGGTQPCNGTTGGGTIFQIGTNGAGFKTLYEFGSAPNDGCLPFSGVVMDAAGNLYGTTSSGGTKSLGTVFELTASGQERILHNFTGTTDGGSPLDGLIFVNGNLYGTAAGGGLIPTVCKNNPGGPPGCGVVFKLTP